MLYDFMIYYYKGFLNLANKLFRRLNYFILKKIIKNILINKLILSLINKFINITIFKIN